MKIFNLFYLKVIIIRQDYKLIIRGDFSVPLNLDLDSNGSKTEKKDAVKIINNLMLNFKWRMRIPDKKRFTWKQRKPLVERRLDQTIG